MRLSEAMRLGAMLRPQNYGALRGRARTGLLGPRLETTCALGAAFEAAGCEEMPANGSGTPIRGTRTIGKVILTPPEWEAVLHTRAFCPGCGRPDVFFRIIAHLNDSHAWTRTRIADLVERIEVSLGMPVQRETAGVSDSTNGRTGRRSSVGTADSAIALARAIAYAERQRRRA